MHLAIDFDGTIHDHKNPKPGRRMGLPMPDAHEYLHRLYAAGHTFDVFTCRYSPLAAPMGANGHVEEWMRYYDLPFETVTGHKPIAEYYIDDRAIRFYNWRHAFGEIQ